MKKIFYLNSIAIALILYCSNQVCAQSLDWIKSAGGAFDDVIYSIDVDAAGNSYFAGIFSDTVDFDPGTGVEEFVSNGGSDIFILKLNPSGDFLWARSFGGETTDIVESVAVDPSGDILISGTFQDTMDIDPGVGEYLVTLGGGTAFNSFVLKLSESGDFVWAKVFGGTASEGAGNLALDDTGNIFITGEYGSTVDFDPNAGTYALSSNGLSDVFVLKWDNDGNFIWARSFGNTTDERVSGIDVDASGNVVVSGYFQSTLDFDPGTGTFNLNSNGAYDVFIEKLDNSGNFQWAVSAGSVENDLAEAVCTDQFGNVYGTGYFKNTVDFDPGSGVANLVSNGATEIFLWKLSGSGNFLWANSSGGTAFDRGVSVTVDPSNDIYLTGYFSQTVDFNSGTGIETLVSQGGTDAFIQKFNTDGSPIWVDQFGGSSDDQGFVLIADDMGNLYAAGVFQDTADFVPAGSATELISTGSFDSYLMKYVNEAGLESAGQPMLGARVYPNPTTGQVVLDLPEAYEKVELTISTIAGEVVEYRSFGSVDRVYLDIQGVEGIYIIHLIIDNQYQVALRVIKSAW